MTKYYYNPEEVAALATAHGVGGQCTDVEAKARQYQDLVLTELRKNLVMLANKEQIDSEQIPFALDKIRRKLGRYGKPQKYWWNWLHENFPIVTVIKKGNSHQKVITMVKVNIPLDILLAGNDAEELIKTVYSDFDPECEVDVTPINLRSLKNYISSTQALNSVNETIQDNLKKARLIYMIADHLDGKLPQVKNKSIFGRTYYQGPNLQNCHKAVREAALGSCFSIDIKTSVFNWKYAMVPFSNELSYTRELIQDRNRVRKHLARTVFGNDTEYSVKTIKRVLTAISFGAKGDTSCWFRNPNGSNPAFIQGSVSTIITSKERRTALFQDPWMREFMKEQDRINSYIYSELVKMITEGLVPEDHLKELKSQSGRISKTKLIAWAYQHNEQIVMNAMLEQCGTEVLLQVHDGVYVKHKPDLASIRYILQTHWPIADVEFSEVSNYSYHNVELLELHRKEIREEEEFANNIYKNRNDAPMPETRCIKHHQRLVNTHDEPDWIARQEQRLQEHFSNHPPEDIKKLIRREL